MHLFKYVNSTQFLQRGVTVNKEPLLTHAWENWFEKTKNMHTTSGYYLTATLKQNKKKQNYFIWGSNVLKGAVWASQMQWCWTFCDVRGKLSEVFFQGTKEHSNILAVQAWCWHKVHLVHNNKSKAWQTVPMDQDGKNDLFRLFWNNYKWQMSLSWLIFWGYPLFIVHCACSLFMWVCIVCILCYLRSHEQAVAQSKDLLRSVRSTGWSAQDEVLRFTFEGQL